MNIIINNYLQIRTYFLVGDYDITVNIEKEHYWAMYNLGFKFKNIPNRQMHTNGFLSPST